MPNPKRRHSNSRTRKRRTHDVMRARATAVDPKCPLGADNCVPHASHRVCPKCGYGTCMCEAKRRERPSVSAPQVPTSGSRRKKTHELNFKTGDVFSATAILNDKLMGHKVPHSILWIQESL